MRNGLLSDLSNNCKTIINNNNPTDSIDLIQNLIVPGTNKKIGKKVALAIYKTYIAESVNYEKNKHNISNFKNKVNKNDNNATKYCNQT